MQLLKTVKESLCNMQHKYLNGRIAQRESTSLTSKGSLVQSQLRPPQKKACFYDIKLLIVSFGDINENKKFFTIIETKT